MARVECEAKMRSRTSAGAERTGTGHETTGGRQPGLTLHTRMGQASEGEGETAAEDTGTDKGSGEEAAAGAGTPEGGNDGCETGIESAGVSKTGSGSTAPSSFRFTARGGGTESDGGSGNEDVSISSGPRSGAEGSGTGESGTGASGAGASGAGGSEAGGSSGESSQSRAK